MKKIVVWDPNGKIPEGAIIEGPKKINAIEVAGGVVLPYAPDLAANNAVAGYFRRGWGNGVHFDNMVGQRGCPMMIYAMPGYPVFHWVIRVEPIDGAKETRGIFRCTSSGQVATLSGGMGTRGDPVEVGDLERDVHGGWIIRGKNTLNCTLEGYLGVSIYAAAVGARVMWSAIAQAAE
jgi:hypothetical protein